MCSSQVFFHLFLFIFEKMCYSIEERSYTYEEKRFGREEVLEIKKKLLVTSKLTSSQMIRNVM